uniref:Lipocalin n=1 Tax=Rhipicephalus zambeziensis TaxID=60191 RepID=A0A224YMR7_9ACAR
MNHQLLGFLPVSAFVLAYISRFIMSGECWTGVLPANSSSTIYLVGYSQQLYRKYIKCVQSEFIGVIAHGTLRRLTMSYTDPRTKEPVTKGLPFVLQFQEDPLVFKLNITGLYDDWMRLTGANRTYLIMYYNKDAMVLADRKRGYSDDDRPVCSLWVTKPYRYLKGLSALANITFHDNCKNATLVSYDRECWW